MKKIFYLKKQITFSFHKFVNKKQNVMTMQLNSDNKPLLNIIQDQWEGSEFQGIYKASYYKFQIIEQISKHIIIQMSLHESSPTLVLSPSQDKRTKRIDSTDDEHTPEKTLTSGSAKTTQRINKTKYKTEMCKNFSETGFCPYRNKCQFAHGENEICKIDPPAKMFYRTRKCHSFWNQGFCSYGFRCQFSHYLVHRQTKHFLEICRFAILGQQTNNSLTEKSRLLQILSKEQ